MFAGRFDDPYSTANSQDPYVALRVYIKGIKPSKLKTFLTEFLLRDPLYNSGSLRNYKEP